MMDAALDAAEGPHNPHLSQTMIMYNFAALCVQHVSAANQHWCGRYRCSDHRRKSPSISVAPTHEGGFFPVHEDVREGSSFLTPGDIDLEQIGGHIEHCD